MKNNMVYEHLSGDEVLSLYAAGRRDFSFTSVSVGDLTGKDLSGINLTGAYLGSGTMSSTNLSETCLFGAELQCVSINGANLTRSRLSHARFSGNIDCSNVNFSGCSFSNVVFTSADLINSNFQGGYGDGSIWLKCDFTGATGIREMLEKSGGIGYWKCIFTSDGDRVTGGNRFS